ncbi:hypothetical protein [Mucilaginibacter pedocola]|nr:hypothetical protein [Mucilaginibacter pedocola]
MARPLIAAPLIGTIISDTTGKREGAHMELSTTDTIFRFISNNLHYTG